MDPKPKTSFTYKLDLAQQSDLIDVLNKGNYRPIQVEYTIIAAETDQLRVNLYKSGKCLVQGRNAQDFITFVLEPQVLKQVGLGYEEMLNPEAYTPHIGIDESGKGDFFGPMVIASAYVDKELARDLLAIGVKDSKQIYSDKKAMDLASEIRKRLGKRFSLVTIGPVAYNRLYSKMRNVNRILAWGHARAIENLLEYVPDCPSAISDQFGNKDQVKQALMTRGKQIELVQRHRAEADVAVAAASILARAAFLYALKELGKKYEIIFHKGASAQVQDSAQKVVEKHGPKILLSIAKCHFKTTDQVLHKLSLERSVLGPEGQAISKPSTFVRRHRAKPTD